MIGYWHHNVVCKTVTLCIVVLSIGVDGYVSSRQLPYSDTFFCRTNRLATTGYENEPTIRQINAAGTCDVN